MSDPHTRRRPAPSNIYTVLVVIATVALFAGIAFVWVRSNQLFGTSNPFTTVSAVTPAHAATLPV